MRRVVDMNNDVTLLYDLDNNHPLMIFQHTHNETKMQTNFEIKNSKITT
jgi:hypothetical protein